MCGLDTSPRREAAEDRKVADVACIWRKSGRNRRRLLALGACGPGRHAAAAGAKEEDAENAAAASWVSRRRRDVVRE